MKSNKKNFDINDEISIDISLLFKKWWYYKFLIIFGTATLTLLSSFILLLSMHTIKSDKYISVVLRGDLGSDNSIILNALKSNEIIDNALKTLSLELSVDEFLKHLVVKKATNPLTLSIQDRIASFKDRHIRELDLNRANLESIVKSLDNTSKDLITIEFYHVPLNLDVKQAKNIINKIIIDVNSNINLRTNRAENKLRKIDVSILDLTTNDTVKISLLSDITDTINSNLEEMILTYSEVLTNVDLIVTQSLTNVSHQILFKISDLIGNSNSIDSLNLDILSLERNITDLRSSLDYIDNGVPFNNRSISGNGKKNSSENFSNNGGVFDVEIFDKILSIGSTMELNGLRIKTLEKIQELQLKKNKIKSQKELFSMNYQYNADDLTIEKIEIRIVNLANIVNEAIEQVYMFTQPEKAVQFIRNPELVSYKSNTVASKRNIVLILSVISFFCLSFFTMALPTSEKLKKLLK